MKPAQETRLNVGERRDAHSCGTLRNMAANPRLTAETLLQKLRSGEISAAEISRYAWRLQEEEFRKFMDLLPQWMNERKHDSNV